LTWVDFQLVISFGLFVACLGVVIQENIAHWKRYGIFIQNGFFEVQSGQFKWEPFFSSVCSFLFFLMSLLLICEKCFGRLHFLVADTEGRTQKNGLINWPLVVVGLPALLLVMRHFLYRLRISALQMGGLVVSLGALCWCLKLSYTLECGPKDDSECQNFYVFHDVVLSIFLALLLISMKHSKSKIGHDGEVGDQASAPYRS